MGKRAQWARSVRPIYQRSAQSLPDEQALQVRGIYDPWAPGVAYGGPDEPKIVSRPGGLYRIRDGQAHTSQEGWEPEKTPAMWQAIDEDHAGTREDPIRYRVGMALSQGLYYTQGGALYHCTRDTGDPVYADLKDLVGLYVEEEPHA